VTIQGLAQVLASRLHASLGIGVSEESHGAEAVRAAFVHARQSFYLASRDNVKAAPVVSYEDLRLRTEVLDSLPDALLGRLRERVLDRLEEIDTREGTDLSPAMVAVPAFH
jgi:sugar diacid utilization regulator